MTQKACVHLESTTNLGITRLKLEEKQPASQLPKEPDCLYPTGSQDADRSSFVSRPKG